MLLGARDLTKGEQHENDCGPSDRALRNAGHRNPYPPDIPVETPTKAPPGSEIYFFELTSDEEKGQNFLTLFANSLFPFEKISGKEPFSLHFCGHDD